MSEISEITAKACARTLEIMQHQTMNQISKPHGSNTHQCCKVYQPPLQHPLTRLIALSVKHVAGGEVAAGLAAGAEQVGHEELAELEAVSSVVVELLGRRGGKHK